MLINSSIYLSKMQKITIKAWLVILLIGIAPSYAQSKQSNTPQEKPWYVGENFIGGVVITLIASTIAGIGGLTIGLGKKVSQAEKDNFKSELLKNDVIPLIDEKIATNEKIKGLELQNILLGIQNGIEKLTTEIHSNFSNQEIEKQSVIKRFDEVHNDLRNQEKNSDKLVDRVNQALQSTLGEYMSVPIVQVRGSRNSKPQSYETDGGNIE
jgi:hypothetical protein